MNEKVSQKFKEQIKSGVYSSASASKLRGKIFTIFPRGRAGARCGKGKEAQNFPPSAG
jgi:hypothetical protein